MPRTCASYPSWCAPRPTDRLPTGSDILLYVLNSFLVQRIVRALHPRFGWHPVFQTLTLFFAFSAPVTIITNITSATVGYLKTEHQNVVLTAIEVLKSTSCWTLILAAYPLVAITLAGNTPGPRPEPFGTGSLRAKTALVLATAAPLTAGAAVRLAVGYVHVRPGSENAPGANPLFGRPVFYTTQFAVEVLVLALYAAARIDLRFHVPDGAAGPGDYAAGVIRPGRVGTKTVEEIQADIEAIGVPYQILGSSAATTAAAEEKGVAGRERLYAVLWANTRRAASRLDSITSSAAPELPELRTDAHPAEKSWFVLEAEDEEGGRF